MKMIFIKEMKDFRMREERMSEERFEEERLKDLKRNRGYAELHEVKEENLNPKAFGSENLRMK